MDNKKWLVTCHQIASQFLQISCISPRLSFHQNMDENAHFFFITVYDSPKYRENSLNAIYTNTVPLVNNKTVDIGIHNNDIFLLPFFEQ